MWAATLFRGSAAVVSIFDVLATPLCGLFDVLVARFAAALVVTRAGAVFGVVFVAFAVVFRRAVVAFVVAFVVRVRLNALCIISVVFVAVARAPSRARVVTARASRVAPIRPPPVVDRSRARDDMWGDAFETVELLRGIIRRRARRRRRRRRHRRPRARSRAHIGAHRRGRVASRASRTRAERTSTSVTKRRFAIMDDAKRALRDACARRELARVRVEEAMTRASRARYATDAREDIERVEDVFARASYASRAEALTRRRERAEQLRRARDAHASAAHMEGDILAQRERALARANARLSDMARAAFDVEVPCALATAESALSSARRACDAAVARAMRHLRALMPITIQNGAPGAAPRGIRACEFWIPDARDADGFDARELAAGLGVLMHFSALASRYLDAPRLHRGAHAGSESYVWAPTSAWDDASGSAWENRGSVHVRDVPPANASERFPLFLPRALVDGSHGDRTGVELKESRMRLKAGIRLLTRSVAAMCAHQCRTLGVSAPDEYGPFAQLCALTVAVARGQDTARMSVQQALPPSVPTPVHVLHNSTNSAGPEPDGTHVSSAIADAARSSIFKRRTPSPRPTAPTLRWPWDRRRVSMDLDEDDFGNLEGGLFDVDVDATGVEHWSREHIVSSHKQSPRLFPEPSLRSLVLPPPPSEIDDTAQWEAAHFDNR